MKVTDLESHAPKHRRTQTVSMTLQTEENLSNLARLLSLRRKFNVNVPMRARDYERLFTLWMSDPNMPAEYRNTATKISITKSYDAAMQYFRDKFAELNPDRVPTNKIGRPTWYLTPQTEQRLLQGEVIAMLINIAGDTLQEQLSGTQKRKAA